MSSRWSVVSAKVALAHLKSRVDESFFLHVKYALRREEDVLWCAGDWSLPKAPPHPDLARVALIVVEGRLTTKESLSLRYGDFVGGDHFVARNEKAFLVLGAVEARDVFSVPDVIGLFPAGITVARVASFEGADSHVQIGHHLHAPLVVSGVGNAGGVLTAGTEARIGAYARYLQKLPEGVAKQYETLEELLPFLEDDGDDEWARIESLKDEKLPASFRLPALGASAIVGTKKAVAKKAVAKKAVAKKPVAKKAVAKKAVAKKAVAKKAVAKKVVAKKVVAKKAVAKKAVAKKRRRTPSR